MWIRIMMMDGMKEIMKEKEVEKKKIIISKVIMMRVLILGNLFFCICGNNR